MKTGHAAPHPQDCTHRGTICLTAVPAKRFQWQKPSIPLCRQPRRRRTLHRRFRKALRHHHALKPCRAGSARDPDRSASGRVPAFVLVRPRPSSENDTPLACTALSGRITVSRTSGRKAVAAGRTRVRRDGLSRSVRPSRSPAPGLAFRPASDAQHASAKSCTCRETRTAGRGTSRGSGKSIPDIAETAFLLPSGSGVFAHRAICPAALLRVCSIS